MPEKKCYPLIISEHFPFTHPRKGEQTNFVYQIKDNRKIHTIRKNFPLWKNRVRQVNDGNAYISIRTWSGKPYRSIQKQFATITDAHIQHIIIKKLNNENYEILIDGKSSANLWDLSMNDGLMVNDFINWFFKPNKSDEIFEGAIIHFTDWYYKAV